MDTPQNFNTPVFGVLRRFWYAHFLRKYFQPDKKILDEKLKHETYMFKVLDRDESGFLENDELVLWVNTFILTVPVLNLKFLYRIPIKWCRFLTKIFTQLNPEYAELAEEEAEHLIEMCDADPNDGDDYDEKLTVEEIIEESELWVDSSITEYGETFRHTDELR